MDARLNQQGEYVEGKMRGYGAEGVANAGANATALQQRLAATNADSTNNLNQLQNTALGGAISSMANQKIDAGGSATDAAMAAMARTQQAGQEGMNQSWANLGNAMSNAQVSTAQGRSDAGVRDVANQRLAIKRNMASRMVDRQFQGSEERAGARSQLATLQGLKGAEFLKNALEMRREQQSYQSERAQQQALARQNQIENNLDQQRINNDAADDAADNANDAAGGGSGGRELWDQPNRLDNNEYAQAAAAAQTILGPTGVVTNWSKFLKDIGQTGGINWSPREARQFKRRFGKTL